MTHDKAIIGAAVGGVLLIVFGVTLIEMGRRDGKGISVEDFFRRRMFSPAWGLFAVLLGLSFLTAGLAPRQRITFTVSFVYHDTNLSEWDVYWKDGSDHATAPDTTSTHVTVSKADAARIVVGKQWTCSVHAVPIFRGLVGDCINGEPS